MNNKYYIICCFYLCGIYTIVSCSKENEVIETTCIECPSVTVVSPSEAFEGDTIKVLGSKLKNAEKVTFEGIDAIIIGNTSDEEISLIVPSQPNNIEIAEVNVIKKINGFSVNSAKKGTFKYSIPSIASFLPNRAFEGDTIEVKGEKLNKVGSVYFNDQEAKLMLSNLRYFIKVPPKSADTSLIIRATQINGKPALIKAEVNFRYENDVIDRIAPIEGGPNTRVTIYGSFKKYNQAPEVKIGSTICIVNSYQKDSITFTVPKGSQSGNVILTSSASNIQSKEIFFYNPNALKSILIKTLPNQNRLDVKSFRIQASNNSVHALVYDQDSLLSKYLAFKKNLVQGLPGNLTLGLEVSKSLKSTNPNLGVTFNLATNNNFAYIIRGSFGMTKGSPNIPKIISRINPSGDFYEIFYSLSKTTEIFDALPNNTLIVGPSAGFMQSYSGTNTIQNFAGKYELDSKVIDAGISSALDATVLYLSGKIYSIPNNLKDEKVVFENSENYTIRNLSVNKSKNLDRIYFQDGNMQRIIMYNVATKTHKIYPITGGGTDFNRICVDTDGSLLGINSKGIYKIIEE